MKTISAMEARKGLGAILDEVRLKSETFILERAGKAIAMITPIRAAATEDDQQKMKLSVIEELKGLHKGSERGENVAQWLKNERENW